MVKATLIAIVLMASVIVAVAQPASPAEGPGGGRGVGIVTPYTALHSPEVHPDRTVTPRFHAPSATKVEVVGEILQGKSSLAMIKGEDGVWTATLGPLLKSKGVKGSSRKPRAATSGVFGAVI